MPRIRKPIGPFPNGVNLLDPPGAIDPGALSKCLNVRLDTSGFPYKRPGHKKHSSNKVNGNVKGNFLYRFYKGDGSKKLIAAAGGKLFSISDVDGTPTQININGSAPQTMEASALCWPLTYKDRLYILDGTKPQRYDGTNDPYAGFYSQNAPTLSSQTTGGSLTTLGTYKYAVASVQGDLGEGPIGALLTVSLTGSNNKINLSVIEDAPAMHGQTAKRIYRTAANLTQLYFLAEIAAGVTTYADTTADTSLGSAYDPVSNPPADCKYAVLGHDQRVYWFGRTGTNASLVHPSDVGFPDRIRDADYLTINANDNDVLMGGGRVPGGVVFLKRKSCWLLRAYGYGPPINISTTVGTLAPWSICEVPTGLMFVGQDGKVYHFDGTNLEEVGRSIKTEFYGMSEASWLRVVSVNHDDRYILSYDWRNYRGFNYKHLEFNLIGRRWEGPHENGLKLTAAYFTAYDFSKDRGQLYWIESQASVGSYIYYRDEFTYDDDGSRAISSWTTGHRVMPGRHKKKVYKLFIKGNMTSDTFLTASVVNDNGRDKTTSNISLDGIQTANALIWGEGNWGAKVWGGSRNQGGTASFGPGASGSNPQLEFSDGGTSRKFVIEECETLVTELLLR